MSVPWMIYVAIGLAAGVLAGLFGIGGGILIIPALVLFVGMEPAMATGTSLGALLLPVGALGAYAYWKRGHVDISGSLWLALGLFIGAYFGARLNQALAPDQARRAFAVFLVLVAARMWFK